MTHYHLVTPVLNAVNEGSTKEDEEFSHGSPANIIRSFMILFDNNIMF